MHKSEYIEDNQDKLKEEFEDIKRIVTKRNESNESHDEMGEDINQAMKDNDLSYEKIRE